MYPAMRLVPVESLNWDGLTKGEPPSGVWLV